MSEKKELRVFISSTFRDLRPEREQLIKKTFPRIRAKCRERGVEFTEIDLRWGITDEESRTGKTIRICLEEIGRCPYFIGILGSRYGWVPGTTELEKDPELLKLFPWLREYSDMGRSIVEMEFAHGALHEKARTSLFYAQAQLREQPSEALLGLASRIQASALPYREFESPDELGEQVYTDLVALLDRDFPATELTPLERERAKHEAFAQNRRQSYVANPEYFRIFEECVNSSGAPLIVWGESGLGKSALMAHLADEYKHQHAGAFVVQHFVGSAENTDSNDVIRHILMEIKERYQLSDEIPTDDAALREEFPAWLAKVSNRTVLFIDALNQLTGIAPEMHWLPDFIPANIRLIVSTTPDVPLTELRKRNWKELGMQPLTGQQVQTIAKQFLGQYRKQLDFAQLATLSLDEKTQRPLFLRTMLEELRMHGSHRSLSGQIEHYLESTDEADLFQRVLARLEEDHGEVTVRAVMSALWAARFGLSEHEIIRVTGLTRVRLSELLIAMGYHLMQREQLYTFFHNYLRDAVEVRYLKTDNDKQAAHRSIAAYFAKREYAARRWTEEPWQWRAADDMEHLKQCLLAPQMLAMLDNNHLQHEAFSYWREFDRIPIDPLYIPKLINSKLAPDAIIKAFSNAIELLIYSGDYHQAKAFYDAGFPLVSQQGINDEQRFRLLQNELDILNHLELTSEVIVKGEAALQSKTLTRYPKLHIAMLDVIRHAYYRNDRFVDAERIVRTSLDECLRVWGRVSFEYTTWLNSLATNLTMQKRYDEAEKTFEDLVSIEGQRQSKNHPDVGFAEMQLAACRTEAGKLDGALSGLERSLSILSNSLGPEHYLACVCRTRIAEVYRLSNNPEKAIEVLAEVLNVMLRKFPERRETASWGCTLGFNYHLAGDTPTGIAYYEMFIPKLEAVVGPENPEVIRRKMVLTEMKSSLAATARS